MKEVIVKKEALEEAKVKLKLLKRQVIHSMKNDGWVFRTVYHGRQYANDKFTLQFYDDHNKFMIIFQGDRGNWRNFDLKFLGFSRLEFWYYRFFYVRRVAINEAQLQKNKEAEIALLEAGHNIDAFFKNNKDLMRDDKLKELTE